MTINFTPNLTNPIIANPKISDFICRITTRGYAQSTIHKFSAFLRRFPDQTFSESAIINFQTHILPLAIKTRISYLSDLKMFLRFAYPDREKCVAIPKKGMLLPQNIPSQADIRQILSKPSERSFFGIRNKAIIELLYSTGIRRSELLNLKITDFNISDLTIRIISGKGGKDRLLPISKKAASALHTYITLVRSAYNSKLHCIFLSAKANKLSGYSLHQILKKYSPFSAHKYRHAFATHLLENGMSLIHLQKLLGHADINTTQIYTHISIPLLKAFYAKAHPRDKWKISP